MALLFDVRLAVARGRDSLLLRGCFKLFEVGEGCVGQLAVDGRDDRLGVALVALRTLLFSVIRLILKMLPNRRR